MQETQETQDKRGFEFKFTGKPDYGFVTVKIPASEIILI